MNRRKSRAQRLRQLVDLEVAQVRAEMQKGFADAMLEVQAHMNAAREADAWDRSQNNLALTKSLDRVADALDGVGNHLALDRNDRAAQAITVEFLLRELVVTFSNPVPEVAPILGGTIDLAAIEALEISPADDPSVLEVGQSVEVLSRYQQRWVSGFAVAEVVRVEDSVRYRLIRRSDRELLPVKFDASDVRLVVKHDPDADLGKHNGAIAEQKDPALDVGSNSP